MTVYTDQERDTIRYAAFGAMTLVSAADPGFMSMFKESMAGAKALAAAPADLQSVLKSGGMPPLPKGSKDEVKTNVLTALRQSKDIMAAKAPQDLPPFQAVIAEAINQVASAHDGVSESERQVITEVRDAVGIAP
ncbi:MAG TPA: hypothetical protein VFC19_38265 [Candidatus Limnocylindrales bacterium]|nr:hypothetical protein [Candidatus Limnocylindrales bacterium]